MTPYKFSTTIEVRFKDVDSLGHVNNAVYLTYFEVARFHYWKSLFGDQAFDRFSFVVVRAECDYRAQAHTDDVLKVWARVSELRRSSFVFSYEVIDSKTGRLIAEGSTVQACFDLQAKKAKSIPDELKERILEFEGTVD